MILQRSDWGNSNQKNTKFRTEFSFDCIWILYDAFIDYLWVLGIFLFRCFTCYTELFHSSLDSITGCKRMWRMWFQPCSSMYVYARISEYRILGTYMLWIYQYTYMYCIKLLYIFMWWLCTTWLRFLLRQAPQSLKSI